MVLVLLKKNQPLDRTTLLKALRGQSESTLRSWLVQLQKQLGEDEQPLRETIEQVLECKGIESDAWKEQAAEVLADNGSFIDVNALQKF